MSGLEDFRGVRKACELFDLVVADMERVHRQPLCRSLVGQQIASADSVCSNIEEGFGRLSRAESIRFLDIAHETKGRSQHMKPWLEAQVVELRMALLDEAIGILTATIGTLRANNPFREDSPAYPANL
ncbi:MAG: four helix bundle protein [Verrucomicrobiae bacterium]|nr:four helix bundle protein [Verrucomicrobiae bacterium]